MKSRSQRHEIEIEAAPTTVFRLLHTPSAIRRWWSVSQAIVAPEEGGIWVACWGDSEDDPDFVTLGTITTFDPPKRFALRYDRYYAKSGPLPFKADFAVEFLIEPRQPNGVRLQVVQSGFPAGPEADAFFASVEEGWRRTLEAIKTFATC